MKRAVYLCDHLTKVAELFRHRPRALITDIDGTISDIAPTPEDAFVSEAIKELLRELQPKFDLLAAITGRSIDEARKMLEGTDLLLVGNHGLEKWYDGTKSYSEGAEQWAPAIADALSFVATSLPIGGLRFENKGVSASIHYRRTANPSLARRAILKVLSEAGGLNRLTLREGKMVVELRPPLEIDKGTALGDLVHQHDLQSVIYLGDDNTDIDAFLAIAALQAKECFRGYSVAVGPDTEQEVLASADFFVRDVAEVESFLGWLNLNLE